MHRQMTPEYVKPIKSTRNKQAATGFYRYCNELTLYPPLELLNGQLVYHEHFLPPDEAVALSHELIHAVPWQQERIRMMGKWVLQPRLTAWYGDPEACYTYAGLINQPMNWLAVLNKLRIRLETEFGCPFNSVLLNLYRNGHDYMGWHSDNERSLGPNPVIASISLGAERRFSFRPRPQTVTAQGIEPMPGGQTDIWLRSGSLLLMLAGIQEAYKHALPKALRVSEPRINLTFRHVLNEVKFNKR